jgi:hypothetical protein
MRHTCAQRFVHAPIYDASALNVAQTPHESQRRGGALTSPIAWQQS